MSDAEHAVTAFSAGFFDELSALARKSARSRQHRNLHRSYDDPCQRLFNAIEPESYIRPHRHMLDPKAECLIAIRGSFTLVTFDDGGNIRSVSRFGAERGGHDPAVAAGVEILPGTWHAVIAHTPGAVLFEVKGGPFNPEQAKEFAAWSPEEGTPAAVDYLARLRTLPERRG